MGLDIDLSTADSGTIVAAARKLDDDAVRDVMTSPHRERVLEAMVDEMASNLRPDKAKDVDAVIHVKVWDKPGGGYDHFELVIDHGTCARSRSPGADADLTLKASPVDLLKLVTGRGNARMMAMRGKLRVQGDLKLGMKLPDLFGI